MPFDMQDFFLNYALFFLKAATIGAAILIVVAGIAAIAMRHRKDADGELEVTHLNKQYDEMEETLQRALLSGGELKRRRKAAKKRDKQSAKQNKTKKPAPRVFVLDFDGDIRASEVSALREEISAVLTIATSRDEVLVRLESGGGMVHAYGLAASQLQRIRDKKIPLTVAVDKVAASGGYMMACVANKILAAPFSIIGSIGVLAQIPNLHRLLKKHDIDFEQLHAGEYKRTLTWFGENTDKAREKVRQELEDTHQQFKDFVRARRPGLEIDAVATGEHWLGARAKELQLVDELMTSDDYLMAARHKADLLKIEYAAKQGLLEKLQSMLSLRARQQQKLLREINAPYPRAES